MVRYVVVLLCLFIIAGWTADAAPATANAASAFEAIKALEGEWKGRRGDGGKLGVTYEVFSAGSAVVETLSPVGEPSMVTVYHMDGEDLRMTHYCAAKNQPRMKAISVSPDGKVVSFEFIDATNLGPTDGHMNNLELTFTDGEHLRHRWTWLENGQKRDNVFEFERVK
jgi:hypothetical protein